MCEQQERIQKLFFSALENRTLDARALAPLLSTMILGNALSAPVMASLPAPPPDVPPDTFESERQSFLAQVRECFFAKTVVIFPGPFHNALVVVAQVRQLQAEKSERARQDEAKAVQAARELEMAQERLKMEAEIKQKYEAELAKRLSEERLRLGEERLRAQAGHRRRKPARSESSGTDFESAESPLSNWPPKR